ncbi:MAG: pantetheine-phosphate adenylyltransferase [Clostridia bacterium]|nr:pantetheine-phosphate adenylyltransferase [Clostridia bacterium]
MSLALIPGSFDPMTVGHLDIVKRTLSLYDEVVVAVLVNPDKHYDHTLEERTEMAELTVAGLERVRVVSSEGMLVDLFDRLGADVIVKGIRNDRDRAYEEKMAEANLALNPRATTIFLQAADDYESVNSTRVRQLVHAGESPDQLVVPAVVEYLRARGELDTDKR